MAARGIPTSAVTLHVGLGTFAPIKADDPAAHAMHAEWCEIPAEAVRAIAATKADGGRVYAASSAVPNEVFTIDPTAIRKVLDKPASLQK